jgi:hypothetical protein
MEYLGSSKYELIISYLCSVIKGIFTRRNQLDICYVYQNKIWLELILSVLKYSGINSGVKGFITRYFLQRLRSLGYITANRSGYYIAISKYVVARVKNRHTIRM